MARLHSTFSGLLDFRALFQEDRPWAVRRFPDQPIEKGLCAGKRFAFSTLQQGDDERPCRNALTGLFRGNPEGFAVANTPF